MIPYKQLSLADIFQDCQNKFNNDKPAFLSLLETHIDIDEFIPISFRNHFYASTGISVIASHPDITVEKKSFRAGIEKQNYSLNENGQKNRAYRCLYTL